jgi:Ca2+-binding EF-hand superfamily protein
MWTLFQIMTLEGWSDIADPIIKVNGNFAFVFVLYVLFTHFTILNLFVAVIVEHVQTSSSTADLTLMREVQEHRVAVFEKLTSIFERADADQSGTLTCDELKAIVDQEDVIETLKILEIDPDEIDWLFDILDTDGNRILSIDEFVDGMLHVKASEQARQLFQVQNALLKEIRRINRHKHNDEGEENGPFPDQRNSPRSVGSGDDKNSANVQEKSLSVVAKSLSSVSESAGFIMQTMSMAEDAASQHGWDERSKRKAKVLYDNIIKLEEAYRTTKSVVEESMLKWMSLADGN